MRKIGIVLASLVVVALISTASIFAYQYLSFTGDEQIQQSEADVNEILEILETVSENGKIDKQQVETLTAKVKELEAMNPSGLAKQNKELRNQVEQLNADLASKQSEIDEKNVAYDNLQQERDQIATARDNAIAERDNIQAQYNTLNDGYTQLQSELTQANEYIDHLESELTRANTLIENHAQHTTEAVEKARTYK